MSSDSEDCTAVGKLFHTRAAVELNARPPMVTCSVRGTSSMADDDSPSRPYSPTWQRLPYNEFPGTRLMLKVHWLAVSVSLQPSSIRGLAVSWIIFIFLHWLLSSTDLSKQSPVSPVHFVMLSCQRVLGLPLLLWPEVVLCIISFSMQFPSFRSTWP